MIFVTLLACFSIGVLAQDAECPDYIVYADGTCYTVITSSYKKWNKAKNNCVQSTMDNQLAEPTEREDIAIREHLLKTNPECLDTNNHKYWLGLKWSGSEFYFQSQPGVPVNYSSLSPLYDDERTHVCGVYECHEGAYYWYTQNCDATYIPFICERQICPPECIPDLEDTTTTSTTTTSTTTTSTTTTKPPETTTSTVQNTNQTTGSSNNGTGSTNQATGSSNTGTGGSDSGTGTTTDAYSGNSTVNGTATGPGGSTQDTGTNVGTGQQKSGSSPICLEMPLVTMTTLLLWELLTLETRF